MSDTVRKLLLMVVTGLIIRAGVLQAQPTQQRPLNRFYANNLQFDASIPAARSLAMGGGAIALPDDPSAVTINPAGLALFARPALSASTRLWRMDDRQSTYSPRSTSTADRSLDQTLISAIVVWKGFSLGTFRETVADHRFEWHSLQPFTVFPPLPADQQLQQNFPSRDVSIHTQLVENGISVGWRVAPPLYAGVSLRLTQLRYTLLDRQYYPADISGYSGGGSVPGTLDIENLYALQTADVRQTRAGFTGGLVARLNSRLITGVVYHHRPRFRLVSNIVLPAFSFNNGNTITNFPSGEIKGLPVKWNLPDAFGAGLAFKYRGWMNIAVDIWRVQLSEMAEGLHNNGYTDLIQNNGAGSANGSADLQLEDRWQFHLGMEYIFRFLSEKRRLPVRFGYYHQPNGIFTTAAFGNIFPAKTGIDHFTAGLGLLIKDRLRFDGALDYATEGWVLMGTSVYTF